MHTAKIKREIQHSNNPIQIVHNTVYPEEFPINFEFNTLD